MSVGLKMVAINLLLVAVCPSLAAGQQANLNKPGCHLRGHTRLIQIPGCVEFNMTTNACRGFCVSYSVPSGIETTFYNPKQVITSAGQCCNIIDSHDVIARVRCVDRFENEFYKDLVFKSAKTCSCSHCKKE